MIAAIYARTSEGRRSRHRACYCLRCEERHESRRSILYPGEDSAITASSADVPAARCSAGRRPGEAWHSWAMNLRGLSYRTERERISMQLRYAA